MDERKDPMTGASAPGVERIVRRETHVRVEPGAPQERQSGYDRERFETDRAREGDRYDPRRERYDLDREGRFDSDSGRIRAGIDHTRSEIDDTVAALQDKLSPERLMHRAMDMLSGSSGASSRQAVELVRRNPVPAALIGLGLGWLALEKTGVFDRYGYTSGRRERSDRDRYERERFEHGRGGERDWLAPGAVYYPPGTEPGERRTGFRDEHRREEPSGPGMVERAGDALGSVREKAGEWAHSAREAISGTGERVRSGAGRVRSGASYVGEHARDLGASARDRAESLGRRTRETAHQARERIEESYDEYPLAMGALALAGGLILGLILPPTRREDHMMGEYRDELIDRAKDTGQELYESSKRVAKSAAQAARDEAEREDLTPGSVMRSVKSIAGRVAEAAEDTASQEGERLKEKVAATTGGAGGSSAQSQTQPGQNPAGQLGQRDKGQGQSQNQGPKGSGPSGPQQRP